jgi:uncharacterized protein (TIGR04255 family)
MGINEIFPKPLVKQVIFAINYPNLFSIEDKIPIVQEKIIEKFPESDLLFRRNIIIADLGPNISVTDANNENQSLNSKIWQFRAQNNFVLSITSKGLDICSNLHKTYNNSSSENKFRDIIKFTLDNFFEAVRVPKILRIGLRYINEGPIFEKTNDSYKQCYNTAFALERFNFKDATEMDFKAVVEKDDYFLRYVESLQLINNEYKIILDFDAFTNNIEPKNYLEVTDDLHNLTSNEFSNTIREPILNYMRNKGEKLE